MIDLAAAIISRNFSALGGELNIAGVPLTSIVAQHETPLFIYDGRLLHRQWNLLRSALPNEFAICYSVKANPNPALIKWFLAKGCGLEIASGGEFHLALAAGCPPERILFAGPGNSSDELELVLANGIGEIHVESLREVERISAISQRLGSVLAPLFVSIPSAEAQGGAMRMGGKPAPFGIDEENLTCHRTDGFRSSLEFRGIHLFTGTQILDHEVLIRQYRKGIEIALSVARMVERPLRTVDFGGGLGIPYFPGEQELNMESLRHELDTLMHEVEEEPLFCGTRFMLEPGRYLVGEAGIYVARVNDIKLSRGKKFLIVDGGMNHHLAASGNLGQVIKRNFPIAILNKMGVDLRKMWMLSGRCAHRWMFSRETLIYRPRRLEILSESFNPAHTLGQPVRWDF